jgi:hypothetical protein
LLEGAGHTKKGLVTATILVFPDWNKEFHVHVDTSCIALGAFLSQRREGDIDHLIAFASRKLSIFEKNYTTTEREGLAMVYALHKLKHYLLVSHFKMCTDIWFIPVQTCSPTPMKEMIRGKPKRGSPWKTRRPPVSPSTSR